MKSIQLTEEHKSKLIEMCKELFPEYDFTLDKWKQCFVTFGLKSKDLYEQHIHWFEFCSRFLMSKLDNLYFEKVMDPVDPFSKQNKDKNLKYPDNWGELWSIRPFLMFTSNLNGVSYKKHPVDYLYEEFKKLKV